MAKGGYWRLGFNRRFGSWLWKLLVVAPLFIVGAYLAIREALPTEYRSGYLFQFLPPFRPHWYWYLICALVYIIVVLLFVAPAANRETVRKVKERHRESFRQNRTRAPVLIHSPASGVEADPNIVPKVETIDVHRDHDGNIIEGSGGRKSRAMVLRCKNERETQPPRRVGNINNVSAQISYTGYGGAVRLPSETAVWLSEHDDKVNFPIDKTHRLVVAVIDGKDENLRLTAVQQRGAALTKKVNETLLDGDLYRVRVAWYADSERDSIAELDLMLDKNTFGVNKPGLVTYNLWRSGLLTKFIIEGHGYWKQHRELGSVTDLDAMDASQLELTVSVENWQSKVAKFLDVHYDEQTRSQFSSHAIIQRAVKAAGNLRADRLSAAFRLLEPYAHLERQIEYLDTLSKTRY